MIDDIIKHLKSALKISVKRDRQRAWRAGGGPMPDSELTRRISDALERAFTAKQGGAQ